MDEKPTYQLFTLEIEQITPVAPGAAVDVHVSCADITIINFHPTDTAYINGMPLAPASSTSPLGSPGATISFGANRYEFNAGKLSVLTVAPAADSNGKLTLGVWVIRKHYTKLVNEMPGQA